MFPADPNEPRVIRWLRNASVRRTLILGSLWLFSLGVLVSFRAVLLPFGLAVLIAFIIEPLVGFGAELKVKGRQVPRIAAILGVYAAVSVTVYIASSLTLPQIGAEIAKFGAESTKIIGHTERYAMEGIELGHPGFAEGIRADTAATLNDTTIEDVPLLYWLGASWLMAISNAREDPELIGELPLAAACLHRALELDPDWDRGAIHEALISLEPSLPMPGGVQRAEEHFAKAVELSGGLKASPYVSLATSICIKAQDRERFESLLGQALAVDLDASPNDRMANTYAQLKARFLLDHLDDLFLE